jgi:hypothetical protein
MATHTLLRRWVIVLPVLQKLKELFRPPFLKQTHERTLDGLHLCARHLGDPAITVHEASSDLLELEVASYVGMHKDFSEFSGCNDELWNEINGIVAVTTELGRRGLIWSEFAVQLNI